MCLIIFHFELWLFYKESSMNTLQVVIDKISSGIEDLYSKLVKKNSRGIRD